MPNRTSDRSAPAVLSGPTWHPAPRLAYALLAALAGVAAMFFLVGALVFGQAKYGYLMAGLISLGVAVAMGWLAGETHRRYVAARGLRSDGLEGIATVLGAVPAGVEHRGHPLLWLDLVVHVEGRPDYRTRVREFVPASMLDRVLAGQPLPVRIDQERPARVVIEWP
ncbi:MAG TPA: hypothetical protein VID47_05245 [Actinomycetota bacterium]